jgi:hypothetical protein
VSRIVCPGWRAKTETGKDTGAKLQQRYSERRGRRWAKVCSRQTGQRFAGTALADSDNWRSNRVPQWLSRLSPERKRRELVLAGSTVLAGSCCSSRATWGTIGFCAVRLARSVSQ